MHGGVAVRFCPACEQHEDGVASILDDLPVTPKRCRATMPFFGFHKWRDGQTPLVVSSYLRRIALPPDDCRACSHAAWKPLELEPSIPGDGEGRA